MKTLGEPPKPFAQSRQYKANMKKTAQVDPGAAELESGPPGKNGKSAKAKKKATLSKIPKVRDPAAKGEAAAEKPADDFKYEPHVYSKLRNEFIQAEKDEHGACHSEAVAAWNESAQKRKLLCQVSIPELRRRRFIEKGCDHNPWASEEI